MSYCVNCGVELADSEKYCPLCDTEVINPKKPWSQPASTPYPHRVERVLNREAKRFVVGLVSLLLIIPAVISCLANYFVSGSITWAIYVVAACFCVFVYALLPLLQTKLLPLRCWIYDYLCTLFLLAVIDFNSGPVSWFLRLGLPLTSACALFALAVILINQSSMPFFHKAAVFMSALGLLVVATELSIKLFLQTAPYVRWSLYALLPCAIIALVLLIFQRQKKLKDEIKRRFYF